MITTGLDTRVNVQQLIESQLPEYLRSENPNSIDFFKQYYASQEYQGGNIDIVDNLDQYLKLDNLTPEVVNTGTTLSAGIGTDDATIQVATTKGFPKSYGLFKINDEIITYTGVTTNSFTGCIRGFCGITSFHAEDNPKELVFSTSVAGAASTNTSVTNLSSLFLKEFYKKQKFTLTPGLEDTPFVSNVNAGTFIKESKSLYQSKGTEESFRILFNVLYGIDPKIIDLEQLVLKPSAAEFIRREILLTERISGDPNKLIGQTITLSTDSETRAAISEVQPVTTKGGKTYYKVSLFVGYNEQDLIKGTFRVAGATKVIGNIGVGASVVTVDSTVGFTTIGTFVSGINTVTYTDKSINQFLNCSGISSAITTSDSVRSDEVVFGYEDGDLTKKVELRITGVLSKFIPTNDIILRSEGEVLGIRNLGKEILNPSSDKNNKEIFANSWIYNTSSRFQISNNYSASTKLTPSLLSEVDTTNLREDDQVEILVRGEKTAKATATVSIIGANNKDITLTNLFPTSFAPIPNEFYDLRRSLRTASSVGKSVGIGTWALDNAKLDIEYGNDILVSDIQNVYIEEDQENDNFYVASNSLSSETIDVGIARTSIKYDLANNNAIRDLNVTTQKYTTIFFDTDVPFITGDEVVYNTTAANPIPGLVEGSSYFIKVLIDPVGNTNRIHLYSSRSFILAPDTNAAKPTKTEFGLVPPDAGYHSFTLKRYSKEKIGAQKLFKKFPIYPNIGSGEATKVLPGGVGLLVNGIEIDSYKSYDKIYYGPLTEVTVFKGGRNYDVVDPPTIRIAQPPTYSLVQAGVVTTGAGVSATVRPIVTGQIEVVHVDQQTFDVDNVKSITVKGGNGSGALLQPIVTQRFRELSFDARVKKNALVGGIDINKDNLIFDTTHNLEDGIKLVYDTNGNNPLGIGPYQGSNAQAVGINSTLQDGAIYWAKTVGISSVKLYPSASDYAAGINTVGFTTYNAAGTHKFRLYEGRNHLRSVKIVDSGSGYTNRKLDVYPVGISTVRDSVHFNNHGFKNGEFITYATTGSVISGLVTTNQYKVIEIDDNEFRLANAGAGGTNTSDFDRNKYVKFEAIGSGVHSFAYPPIELVVDAKYAKVAVALTESITVTPVVRGSIKEIYVYDGGTGYGSTVLNFEKNPIVTIVNGELAELKPIISNKKLYHVDIQNQGGGYTAPPDLVVEGDGFGAEIRAIIENGVIVDVKVLNSGTGYSADKTSIKVTSPGVEGSLISKVRQLSVNNYRFADKLDTRYHSATLSESKNETNQLKYSFVGYATDFGKTYFNDPNPIDGHSSIIGWAYDGNPIYGPYGFSDPLDSSSSIVILKPSYKRNNWSRNEDTGAIVGVVSDRPIGFNIGFFVEDYNYDASGDLDEKNGRYCRTPEYPNGTYAYFVGVTTSSTTGKLVPKFPYFIGDSYRSIPQLQNILGEDQKTFNFNGKSLARNTFPYKVSDDFADNDFLVESNELVDQITVIDSITKGSVDSFQILQVGSGYKVGEVAGFDNTGTNGGGLSASIKRITGKDIFDINTTIEKYQDVVFKWNKPDEVVGYISTSHSLIQKDNITVSGLSTSINSLSLQNHNIGITTGKTYLYKALGISQGSTVGVVTDIYVANIPEQVSVGSTIEIGTEKLSVLNLFEDRNILRVKRGESVGIHTLSTEVRTVPSYFTIPVKTPYFESRINDKVYFNASQAIGVGTQVGIATTVGVGVGETTNWVSIPSQSIHIPNHPFKHNQKVSFNIPSGANQVAISTLPGLVSPWNFGVSGGSKDVYIINKSKDYIGFTTMLGICTSGVFFHTSGSNNPQYSFESSYTQVTGKVEKITTSVSISTSLTTSHGMLNGDVVGFTVKSNSTVGIGTSTAIKVKFNDNDKKLLVNPITFAAANVTSASNSINLELHNLKSGQKIFYDGGNSQIVGLSTRSYYVYKVDDDNIKLGESRKDVINDPPILINFTSTGGSGQELSLINPQIEVIRNNNLKFDLTDSSLQGYDFKLFYDNKFNNQYVSTGQTDVITALSNGIPGVSIDASFTLNYSEDNPEKLYYSLEKSGFISTSDTDVVNFAEINFIDSKYNGNYVISGVGDTTFKISLRSYPESLFYSGSDQVKYNTTSRNTTGGIGSMRIEFGGVGYKKLPEFTGITNTNGKDGNIVPESKEANRIGEVRIVDPGFEYSADPTLRPEALISPIITIKDASTITNIEVVDGGKDYISAPDLIIVDPETNTQVDNGFVSAVMDANALTKVNIIDPAQGLTSLEQRIVALNNSNGIQISKLEYNNVSGRATATLQTPTLGFTTPPFTAGDEIFVEGLDQFVPPGGTAGDGFNSTDHGYKFFKVNSNTDGSALASNPVKVAFQINEFTANPGLAQTSQLGYATVVKKLNYPVFKTTQDLSLFQIGESVAVFINGNWAKTDIVITESLPNSIKIGGKYRLSVDSRIKGETSGTIATINTLSENSGYFGIDYSLRKDEGWNNETGKLSVDHQVLSDNDYYQNMSYSIKSPLEYEDVISPVNRLLHTAGMKNFADVGIKSSTKAGISSESENATIISQDLISEHRVDTVNIFDFAKDVDTLNDKSRFLSIQNKKLTSYILCESNRVLEIDDISSQFSNSLNLSVQSNEVEIDNDYSQFLIQIKSPITDDTQLTELTVFRDVNDIFTLERGSNFNTSQQIIDITGKVQSNGISVLSFNPTDPLQDYDIKIYTSKFNTSVAGLNTSPIGFIDLVGVTTTVGIGTSTNIISVDKDKLDAYQAKFEITDLFNSDTTIVDLYLTHDDTSVYSAEVYTDSQNQLGGYSSNFIGTFHSNISNGVLSLDYENTTSNAVSVRSKIVGFGTTAVGVGTHRFKDSGQAAGTERSMKLESSFVNIGVSTGGIAFDNTTPGAYVGSSPTGISSTLVTSIKSNIRVSIGQTSAIHQLLTIWDGTDARVVHYPFVSIGTTTGIGTFQSNVTDALRLQFIPDAQWNGQSIEIQRYDEIIYSDTDSANTSPNLIIGGSGGVTESLTLMSFNGTGARKNKTEFDLNWNGVPIFEKTFNPSNSNSLNTTTGVFTINDHFFNTGEQLVYTPKSTWIGVAGTAIETSPGTVLPTTVYAIRETKDTFKLAISKANALAGTNVVFTSTGGGNKHELEMLKKMEKSVILISGLIQSPITYSPLTTTLKNNVGNVSAASTIINLAGISSIAPNDIFKIDDEFIKVNQVGVGTTSVGPISGIGTFNLITVDRGFVGTSTATHNNGATVREYKGSFNIVGSKIHFTDPPAGSNTSLRDLSNLEFVRSTFDGRAFLRQDYRSNVIFDDVSHEFTGIKSEFTATVSGVTTAPIPGITGATGIGTGSSLVLVNGIFQTPSTPNNDILEANYKFIGVGTGPAGISSVQFTGITSTDGTHITSTIDANLNQLPRGGMIVSLGSTGGIGIAPLKGANLRPIATNKTITGFVGFPTTGSSLAISTASYDNITGYLKVTTTTEHFFQSPNELVRLRDLHFTCGGYSGAGTTVIFPDAVNDKPFDIVAVDSATEFTADVGVSTIPHTFVGAGGSLSRTGIASAYYADLTWGSGYSGVPGIATISVYDQAYEHKFVSATTNALTVNAGGIGANSNITPTTVSYASTSGDLVIYKTGIGKTTPNGSLTFDRYTAATGTLYSGSVGILTVRLGSNPSPALAVGQLVCIDDLGLTFTCAKDNHATDHKYPRYSDPASMRWFPISNIVSNIQFEINVLDTIPSSNVSHHIWKVGASDTIKRSANTIAITNNSLSFTCARDNHKTEHSYPRATDPVSGLNTSILSAQENSITVNVRPGGGAGTGANIVGVTTFNTHRYNGGTATNAIFQNTWGNNPKNVTNATYAPDTGLLVLTSASHGYSNSDTVGIDTGKIVFTCARDNFTTDHGYPRAGYAHSFSSSASTLTNAIVSGGAWNGTGHTPTDASYNPTTGLLVLTKASHGLTLSDTVGIRTGSLVFKCSKDNYTTDHTYPRVTDPINGLANIAIVEKTTDTITIQVGRSLTGADPIAGISTIPIVSKTTDTITLNVGRAPYNTGTGGSLLFNVTAPGSGYVNPAIAVSPPSYENLEIEGVSRLGVGATKNLGNGSLITVNVGSVSTVGTASTLVSVESFKIARSGFGFEVGDVFKPVGLVTDYRIPSLIEDLEFTVDEIFTDRYSSWNFGEFDYIDSIKSLQNDSRTRFPLYYNGNLLSFETDNNNSQSALIDINALLMIFCNGVLQNPGDSYAFNGGTSIDFAVPPNVTDNIAIFFYRGTVGVDSRLVNIRQSLKVGDKLQIRKDNTLTSKPTQNPRTGVNLFTSDIIETDIYSQQGIDEQVYKPMSWTRQKVDKVINGQIVYKNRDLYEPLVYPSARIIADVSTTDTNIFVDNADFFKEDVTGTPNIDGLIIPSTIFAPAELTATVSAAGTVNPLTIVSGGSGYVGSTTSIIIGIPTTGIGAGVGVTATATATITNGSISAVTIVNPGLGYTNRSGLAPQVIAPTPQFVKEEVTTITSIEGFSGIITGITTTRPTSTKLAFEFHLRKETGDFSTLSVGDSVYIYDTAIGSGSTSLWNNNNNNPIGIGTTFIDNVYRIAQLSSASNLGIITCFVHTGLTTTTLGNKGDRAPGIITGRDYNLGGVGKFSWGKLSSLTRDDTPIAIGVTGFTVGVTSHIGITTFPTIQRRGYGLNDTGALEI